jgi:LEA14-like dessication related protein
MRYLLRVIVIVILIIAIAIGTQVYGYSSLQTDFNASGVSPQFNTSVSSIAQSVINVFSGNLLGAASSLIKGLNVEGSLVLKNNSFVPIYLPDMEHTVSLNGIQTQGIIPTDSMWLAPRGSHTEPFAVLIDKADLSQVVLNLLANGGNIEISVDSSASIGGFTITKNSHKEASVTNALSSYVSSGTTQSSSSSSSGTQYYSTNPSITSYGFSLGHGAEKRKGYRQWN